MPKFSLVNLFKNNNEKVIDKTKIKKEPIINNVLKASNFDDNDYVEDKDKDESNNSNNYLSPSLEILDANSELSKTKILTIKQINLLEKVFEDFNIDIKVINVKLGPVVTLFEILPAAGIK